jgi:hypothetical protein
LFHHRSVGTLYSDHDTIWFPKKGDFRGQVERAPKANASGALWYVDDTLTNSFRALRIWNASHNMMYAEFDHAWTFTNRSSIEFFEAYDLEADPWALNNIYDTLSAPDKASLHENIAAYFTCSGAECP